MCCNSAHVGQSIEVYILVLNDFISKECLIVQGLSFLLIILILLLLFFKGQGILFFNDHIVLSL